MVPNPSLKPYNTFGVNARARALVTVSTPEELEWVTARKEELAPLLFLGGGSNLLFTRDFDGTVVLVRPKGLRLVSEENNTAIVSAGAGENWHEFVQWTISQNLGGLENLSLIPGNVGTAPMQNIGAYGVEMKDCFHRLLAYDMETGEFVHFNGDQCRFGYRDSIFKQEGKGRYVIWEVEFALSRRHHTLHLDYGAIREELRGIKDPGIREVSEAVIRIRQSKLPDPAVLGNCGSFFKNPVVGDDFASQLKKQWPEMVQYPAQGGTKLAAGWLIEQAGWKGYRRGDAGIHAKQALVLVNYGSATGPELWQLAREVMASVEEKFGVSLEPEVNIL